MIKHGWIRILIIPLLGMLISYGSGIISFQRYSTIELIGAFLYFATVSFCIWKGCQWIHLKLRSLFMINQNPFSKILSLCGISAIYGSAVAAILCLLWMEFSRETFNWDPVNKCILFSVLAVIVLTLLYEVLYLSKERELDNKIVAQLDNELTRAEITALRNELDPHFIFNSLNTLSHLISNDPVKADQFNNKLAQVYRYFLLNKEKEMVMLEKEIEFIRNYCFLLQIRHDDKLQLNIALDTKHTGDILVVPCALQLLVENAIKHNVFTHEEPLRMIVSMNHDFLIIENSVRERQVQKDSTKVGLRNLSAQYKMITKKNIVIENFKNRFVVKLPLIKSSKKEFT